MRNCCSVAMLGDANIYGCRISRALEQHDSKTRHNN